LAHEVREPLASILFAVECTNQAAHEESASRKMCEIIERQVRCLARMIEDVLDVSHGESGKLLLCTELYALFVVTLPGVIHTIARQSRFRRRNDPAKPAKQTSKNVINIKTTKCIVICLLVIG